MRRITMRLSPAMIVLGVLGSAQACRPSSKEVAHDSAVGSIGTAADAPRLDADTVGHGAIGGMADPDQRFLRWMLAHHAEVVYLAHQGARHPDSARVRAEARAVDQSHDAETVRLRELLRSEFRDTTSPAIRSEHVAMVAPFANMSGESYGSAFRSFLAAHHAEAVKMTDSVLAQLRRPAVRQLAADLRAARRRDIARLSR